MALTIYPNEIVTYILKHLAIVYKNEEILYMGLFLYEIAPYIINSK